MSEEVRTGTGARRVPILLGLYAQPPTALRWALGILPFVLLLIAYFAASEARLERNAADKLLPSFQSMFDAMYRMAFEEDQRSGTYLLLNDTIASLKRLMVGVGCAAAVGLMVGLNVGLFPALRVLLLPAITFVSIIPPLALLPILFIVFGVDELSKIVLIFIGVAPAITRDLYLTTSQIPTEQITKALTLGASTLGVVYQVILPQILPRLIEAVRLSLGAAWLFLIASEAIASTEGLGYRIFLVRRYLSMDVIIPYALWITFLGFLVDYALRVLLRYAYPWYSGGRQQ